MTHQLIPFSVEALEKAFHDHGPASLILKRYLRTKSLGKKERLFVSDIYYGVIRHKRSLEYLSGSHTIRAWANYYREFGENTVEREQALWEDTRLKSAPPAVRYDVPDWMLPRLTELFPDPQERHDFIFSINQNATIDLRTNTLKIKPQDLLHLLEKEGHPVQKTPWAPTALRLPPNSRFHAPLNPSFQKGYFEIQDEGSQLIAHWCHPKHHEIVVDFCAGAGGKSLALSSLMGKTGHLYACDTVPYRLNQLKERRIRSGASNITTILLDSPSRILKKLGHKADRVLVDSPCSGSGTWRRNPDLKWRYHHDSISEFQKKQADILSQAAQLLKKGGCLIYATCSLWKEENKKTLDRFLLNHPHFSRLPQTSWRAMDVANSQQEEDKQLYTHKHHTDSFFIGIVIRQQ